MAENVRDTGPQSAPDSKAPLIIGRYVLGAPIARGGMATIHIARLTGVEGFSRMVAAKRLNPELTEDHEFVAMFLDEARIASKVHHPNVVPVLDVVMTGNELVLVEEYIHGVPLSVLFKEARRRGASVPVPIAVTIVANILAGLEGAHEARDELGQHLEIVHRDVSPQNVMVAVDGTARLLDFGVAKATLSAHITREGTFKGKIAYTAPEQLRGVVSKASDIYATGVILWEALVGRRMHEGATEQMVLSRIMTGELPTISDALAASRQSIPEERWEQLKLLEPMVSIALALEPEDRFTSAAAMEQALVDAIPRVPPIDVAEWMRDLGQAFLAGREKTLANDEASWRRQRGGAESGPTLDSGPRSSREPPMSMSPPSRSGVASRPGPRSPLPPMPPPPEAGRTRRLTLFAAAAVLLVTLGVLATVGLRRVGEANEPPAPSGIASSPPSPATAPAAATVPTSTSSVATAAPSATAGDATVAPIRRAPPPPPVYVGRRGSTPSPAVPPPTPNTTSTTADPCNPPYYFDGKKKLYKPGCL